MNYEERLMYITRNLIEYKLYGNDLTKAGKVVRKYFKEKPLEECIQSLELFMKAYYDGISLVETNKKEYWESKKVKQLSLEEKEKEFFEKHNDMSEAILKSMILWIFNWYHER